MYKSEPNPLVVQKTRSCPLTAVKYTVLIFLLIHLLASVVLLIMVILVDSSSPSMSSPNSTDLPETSTTLGTTQQEMSTNKYSDKGVNGSYLKKDSDFDKAPAIIMLTADTFISIITLYAVYKERVLMVMFMALVSLVGTVLLGLSSKKSSEDLAAGVVFSLAFFVFCLVFVISFKMKEKHHDSVVPFMVRKESPMPMRQIPV